MIKKLCTLLLLATLSAPLLAQTASSNGEGVIFAPQKGQWQVSMFLGGGNKFYNENTTYLLPRFTNTSGEVGLPNGGSLESGDLSTYLQIDGLNGNNLTNIIGFEGKYFLSDCWDINLQFSMDINLTPKKDYIEGEATVPDMIIPAQKYINAQATNNWYVGVGSNRYFKVSNPRIHPYLGAALGFQMARIETSEPYTGETYADGEDEGDDEVAQAFLPKSTFPAAAPARCSASRQLQWQASNTALLRVWCWASRCNPWPTATMSSRSVPKVSTSTTHHTTISNSLIWLC